MPRGMSNHNDPNGMAEARRNAGLDQRTAARLLGMAPSTLCNLEHGRTRPTGVALEAMARLYHAPARRLARRPVRPRPIDRHVRAERSGRLRPPADLMAEWLVLSGAWEAFGADACAAMLEERPGYACRAAAYMGHVRLVAAAPWGAHAYPVPGTVADGVWSPGTHADPSDGPQDRPMRENASRNGGS